MSQNLVIPTKDNKVVFVFTGIDLTAATDIKINFGAETYTKLLNASEVVVTSATELTLDLSSTAEVGRIFATITYFDIASVNGTDITSQELGNSSQIIVAIGTQLIIEDGSQAANANSFVTDDEYKTYASIRGLIVASTQPDREADLMAAMDYLKSTESGLQGNRVSRDQVLLFPRYNVMLHGYLLASDFIPVEIKAAQMEAAIFNNTNSILVNSTNSNVRREKLDVLETEYFKGGSSNKVNLQRVNAQLLPLMKDSNALVRS